MNNFDTSTENIYLEKDVSCNQVFSIFFRFNASSCCSLCFVVFHYYKTKIINNAFDWQVQKMTQSRKKMWRKSYSIHQKIEEDCKSSLDKTENVELKGGITAIQNYKPRRVTGRYNSYSKVWRFNKKCDRNILFSLMFEQWTILRQFKDFEQLFEAAVYIESTLYFKINRYKFIIKIGNPDTIVTLF